MSAVVSATAAGKPVGFARRLLSRPLAVLALTWLVLLLVSAVGGTA